MRSSGYYGARAFARELNRQRNQHERSMEAAARREAKEEMYSNGYAKEEQENNRLELQKRMCFHYADLMIKMNPYFKFELLKEKYIPNEFEFEDEPEYIDRASTIIVPKEKKIEKIFKSVKNKRVDLEEKKKKQIESDKEDFEKRKKIYNSEKANALKKFNEEEEKRKNKIEVQNKNVDKFEEQYLNNEKEAQEQFLLTLLTNYLNEHKTKMFANANIGYTSGDKTLILELEMADVHEYFEFSNCKYVKTKNELSYSYYKDSEIKKEFTVLLPKIAIGFCNLFLGNDLNNSIDNMIVNILYNEIYLLSYKISKEEFEKLDLRNLGDLNKINNDMRIFKSLQTGIKVFDYIK